MWRLGGELLDLGLLRACILGGEGILLRQVGLGGGDGTLSLPRPRGLIDLILDARGDLDLDLDLGLSRSSSVLLVVGSSTVMLIRSTSGTASPDILSLSRNSLPILSRSGRGVISTSLSGDPPRLIVFSDVVDGGLGGGEGETCGSSIIASSGGGGLGGS